MEAILYNQKGKETGKIQLSENIFGLSWNADLVHQVVTSMESSARTPVAHTKNRGDVRGGGKKPWKQKGTGRARHGSIRSPIWVGGGVAHGPRKARSFEVKINKKMKSASVRALLSRKLNDGQVAVFDQFSISLPKTKNVVMALRSIGNNEAFKGIATRKKTLLAISRDISIIRATRNAPYVFYTEPRNMTTTALLHTSYVVLDQSSLAELTKTFA